MDRALHASSYLFWTAALAAIGLAAWTVFTGYPRLNATGLAILGLALLAIAHTASLDLRVRRTARALQQSAAKLDRAAEEVTRAAARISPESSRS